MKVPILKPNCVVLFKILCTIKEIHIFSSKYPYKLFLSFYFTRQNINLWNIEIVVTDGVGAWHKRQTW